MKASNIKKLVATSLAAVLALSLFNTIKPNAGTKEKDAGKTSSERPVDLERKIVGYFPEWAYKSEAQGYFNVTDLQWDYLTHIQYSFAMVDPATNKITFGDKHAAVEETFEGMDLDYKGQKVELDPSLPYKGHFNLMQVMKKKNPNVDLLMSVGGWAGSRGFYTMMDTDQGIETFANSCVDFIREYGFDGIDIDFEYPSSTGQSGNPDDFDVSEPRRKTINERYNVMMKILREKLDEASKQDGKQYLLTAAVTASSWVLGGVSSNEYAKYLDFLSVMSYDFHGGWNEFVENLANIYPDPADKETIQMLMPVLCMDWAYRYYRGVLPPEKILMGIPYYSRGWENVNGGVNGLHGTSKFPASGKYNVWGDDLNGDGELEPAGANPLWHILNLMEKDDHLKEYWDDVGKVPHVWQDQEKVFLSFENERSIDERLKYIQEKNLGGALIWVMNGDYGLNPNYVEGSDNINEGKYTFGDTLTKRLSQGLDKMGPCKLTDEDGSNLQEIAVDVDFGGVYDHPNYTYSLKITNHTTETLNGDWTLTFDLPKSAIYKSSWGGTAKVEDLGKDSDFNRVTITGAGWQKLAPGATVELQGMIGLCFSGIRNITFNGCKPVGKDGGSVTPPTQNTKPVLNGVQDKTITVGDKFDALAGVTANDAEDGDLTSKIKVSGTVDTNKAGKYTLTYEVTDSKGAKATKSRTITVKDEETTPPTENQKPVLNGVQDKTIKVGDKFDALAGVTANDAEDGDLTSKIKVSGTVDTNKAGKYTLTYEVTDSKGAKTTAKATITVKADDVTPPTGDTYDANKVYNSGDKVIYKGKEYTAKWWVKGEAPDSSAAWEITPELGDDGAEVYVPGKAYSGGQVVSFNGKKYKANWWTQSKPDSNDGSWSIVK